ncbi:hypothetical protein MTR67_001528 [Solanum verrucosum]|uniref:Tf2-1-like SH3-like domain-containing protein n=1 Tax=Solanum verrucosum TaxID=315347 RepID=A0AAF0PNC2_SOLVR|nr:hypothetical protein MTR67_001528 [Solanum verrucosum]
MYRNMWEVFWWNGIKRAIADFVAKCPNCQQRVMIFGKKGKPSPRYVGPYRIFKRVSKVAYELELAAKLAAIHPVFHIILLKRCVGNPASIVPLESVVV